jgi:hypothetical protein
MPVIPGLGIFPLAPLLFTLYLYCTGAFKDRVK